MSNNNNLNIHSLIPIEALLRNQAYIGGLWVDSDSQFRVINPRTRNGLARVAQLSAVQCQQALTECERLFAPSTFAHRHQQLSAWIDGIGRCQHALTLILSEERGCRWSDALHEVTETLAFAIEQLQTSANNLSCNKPVARANRSISSLAGCARSPLLSAISDALPLMLEGRPVLLRPDRKAPLCLLALAVIAEQSGLTPGYYNVIP